MNVALAQKNQQMYDAASETILRGLAKDSSNNDLKKLQKEVNEFMRVEKVEALIKVAKEVCDNKIVSVLEGGYDLMALQESTSLHVQSLLKV